LKGNPTNSVRMEVVSRPTFVNSFPGVLQSRARLHPDKVAFIYLENGEHEAGRLTYAELEDRAQGVASRLRMLAQPGSRALLLYPTGLSFVVAFLGCLYAGVIAVPAYPPRKGNSQSGFRRDDRLEAITRDSSPVVALTNTATLRKWKWKDGAKIEGVPVFALDEGPQLSATTPISPDLSEETIAFLQYTSGSTGNPKGVVVSHGNILSNVELIAACVGSGEATVGVSWLPLFHDMGLLGTMLTPIYLGGTSVLMDPGAFIQKPVRWLDAISRYRATASAAPNSAYDLCVRQVSDEEKAHLNLSGWRIALNGSEPVRPRTVEGFARAFASCGFRAEAMRPVYGMAEATLLITGQPADALPVVKNFDGEGLSLGRGQERNGSGSRGLVSCGGVWGAHNLQIVNPETCEPIGPAEIGEIWFAGPSVAKGYWQRLEQSEETFRAQIAGEKTAWLRTGDLGFINDDGLFIVGRLKDLIIVAGRNLYPQDLERTAEASDPVLAPNASAAFSVDVEGEERIVLACEVRREALRRFDVHSVTKAIRRVLTEQHDASLHAVIFLRPASLPRTSSGKVQRRATRLAYLQGEGLDIVAQWQRTEPASVQSAGPDTDSSEKDGLESWLRSRVAVLSGIAVDKLDIREPFNSYGLNSSEAIALSGELEKRLGRKLPQTLIYNYPSIALLSQYLSGRTDKTESGVKSGENGNGNEEIALIGIGCRFPGASDPESFWRLLREGRDAVADSPKRVSGLPPTGLLEQVDQFDAEFFGINAREAEAMDPQQRLFLEVAWEAVEHAGLAPQSLAGSRTAVVIGISTCDYARLMQGGSVDAGPYASTGNALSIAPNRISYALDLRGPSWAVDTACSSSLVALHQACGLLRRGECDAALVGGVNLILVPELSEVFTRTGMLSPDGVCRAFDEKANGYVRGEGVGVVLLKRLSDALRDGDRIEAVVRGAAVNQDGRSNGLTAPNGPAQQAVIRAALRAAGAEPREIGLVEAHGTGTPLGDPIEMNALMEVLGEGRAPEDVCWIGSVKTNVGHLEAAAGIASVIKAALSLKHREIVPHLHFRNINSQIDIKDKPFRIAERALSWEASGSRLVGVSSFGFGGTNAHVVLAEPPGRAKRSSSESSSGILAFSARTPEALRSLRSAYAEFLVSQHEAELEDFVFTVNRSRSFFSEKSVIIFDNREDLITKLKNGDAGRALGSSESLNQLAVRYLRGDSIDWSVVHAGQHCKPIAVPTYPFKRKRHWIETRGVHPLLGRRLQQTAHLPAVWTWEVDLQSTCMPLRRRDGLALSYSAYVEMALSAVAEMLPESSGSYSEVSQLNLVTPLIFHEGESRRVQTVLSQRGAGTFSVAVYQHGIDRGSEIPEWQLCARAEVRGPVGGMR
jgi:acyl-CoA synthetase (AMP-forming)/AMP-acid ligase II/3-oxoacyl-(acyl-carrier-protein) synthase/acyl carrier protein